MPRLTAAALEARRLASAFVPEAIERLIDIARNGPRTAQLAAIEQLLSRAIGRPESHAIIEQVSEDESNARAFALALVQAYPELAEAAFSGKALPAVIDIPAVPEAPKP